MDNRSPLSKLKNILYSGWGEAPPQYAESMRVPTADAQGNATEPMALPNGGMQGEELASYIKNVNTGPVATTGENPMANADRDSNIFDRVSAQYKNQQEQDKVAADPAAALAGAGKAVRGPAKSGLLNKLMPSAEAAEPIVPTKPLDPYGEDLNDAALKQAQQRQNLMDMFGGLSRAGGKIGHAIAGVPDSDTKFWDEQEKNSGKHVKDIQARRDGKDKELARNKAMKDLQDDDAMRDPNSAISKSLREGALLAGMTVPPNVSGKMLHDSGLNLGTLLNARMAAEARKDAARLAAEARKDAKDDKKENRDKEQLTKNLAVYEKKVREIGLPSAAALLADIDVLTNTPDLPGVGTLAGAIPNFMAGDKARDLRAKGGEMRGALLKLRSGGAVTPEEFARFDKVYNSPGFMNTEHGFRLGVEIFRDNIKAAQTSIRAGTMPEVKEAYEAQGGLGPHGVSAGNQYSPRTEEPTKKTKVDPKDTRVDDFMKANPDVKSRDEAIKILKENGYM